MIFSSVISEFFSAYFSNNFNLSLNLLGSDDENLVFDKDFFM